MKTVAGSVRIFGSGEAGRGRVFGCSPNAAHRVITIFERLTERPCAVGELAIGLPVSRPAVSQHLKVLKDAGLVVDERAGNRNIYRINPDGLAELRADLDRFWSSALVAYKAAVEQQSEEEVP